MCSHNPWSHHHHRKGAFDFDPSVFAFWGGPWRRRGGPWRGGRMFEQGDLKYVILQLLEEKPRHGYEIIKELEERFSGAYSPSPGTVYPTLTMLVDLGFAVAREEEGGKKIYEITDAGRAHLAEHKTTVDDIFERMAQFGSSLFGGKMTDVNRAFADLGRAIYGPAFRRSVESDVLAKMREVLERAAKEIDELTK
jgi:DNA-binding PadR family transcriptional regulator